MDESTESLIVINMIYVVYVLHIITGVHIRVLRFSAGPSSAAAVRGLGHSARTLP